MKTTGMGTDETMAEMKTAGQPVVVTQIAPAKMTLAEVHAKLDGKTGRRFWKNLDELAETPAFHELMREEFPRQAGSMAGQQFGDIGAEVDRIAAEGLALLTAES